MKAGKLKLIYEELTYKIIGIAMKIHKELGPDFLEAVYEEAMIIELKEEGIPFQNQVPIEIEYRGKKMKKKYRADFVIDNTDCTNLNRFHRFQRSFIQSV